MKGKLFQGKLIGAVTWEGEIRDIKCTGVVYDSKLYGKIVTKGHITGKDQVDEVFATKFHGKFSHYVSKKEDKNGVTTLKPYNIIWRDNKAIAGAFVEEKDLYFDIQTGAVRTALNNNWKDFAKLESYIKHW